jgi:hypothetical protein
LTQVVSPLEVFRKKYSPLIVVVVIIIIIIIIIRMRKSRRVRLAIHVEHMGEIKKAYNILVDKPQGKRPPSGIHAHIREDNIKIDLKEWCVRL